jgi:hypothetical protein
MRGIVPGIHPVTGHLLRSAEQIREDAGAAAVGLTTDQLWSKPHGMTSPGFHLKHLAGSTNRLLTYLEDRQLTSDQLAAILAEGEGSEDAATLLSSVNAALDRYEAAVRSLSPEDFGAVKEIGRKKYQTTAISLAIHIAEHAQRHIGGLIAAAKLARAF